MDKIEKILTDVKEKNLSIDNSEGFDWKAAEGVKNVWR